MDEYPIEDLEITPRMADLLRVFLEDPGVPHYGFDLMRRTRQPSGTLYPLLAKMQAARWLTVGTEDIDPSKAGRPARRFYRITGAAVLAARAQLTALSQRYAPPAPVLPRLEPNGGTL